MDGTITDGVSSLNTVALTGESVPRDVGVGDDVLSGCINISGVLRVKVGKSFGASTASKIIKLVEESAENKSHSETFIRRFSRVYTPIVVFLAIGVAFVPPFFCDSYGQGLATWVYRALSFLVVSCPCALVISVPLSFFGGIGGASRKGILIKGGNYMDALARLSTVVFDKTGTLTQGVFAVDAVHPEAIDANDLLHLTAHAEEYSTHPIACALRAALDNAAFKDAALGSDGSVTNIGELLADGCRLDNVEEIAGQGIRATVNGHAVSVGNVKLMEASGAKVTECEKCKNTVGTIIHVAVDGVYAGHIVIADKEKADGREAIAGLKRLGVRKTVMLTGDHERVAGRVAEDLGLDEYHASLLPQDKVEWVERLINGKPEGSTLAFVGDGINDAPVLARADVGIAMGALGVDAAIEAADVVLMDDKPSKIATAIHIARRTIANALRGLWRRWRDGAVRAQRHAHVEGMRKRLNHEPQTDGRPAPVGIQDKAAIACHGSLVGHARVAVANEEATREYVQVLEYLAANAYVHASLKAITAFVEPRRGTGLPIVYPRVLYPAN